MVCLGHSQVLKGSGFAGPSITQARPFTVGGSGDFQLTQFDLGITQATGLSTFQASIWTTSSGRPT